MDSRTPMRRDLEPEAKRQLIEELLAEEGLVAPSDSIAVRPASLGEPPLSFAQERLWFLAHLEPGNHYNDHFHLRLRGPLDVPALERSLDRIVARHEALRTTFPEREGRPIPTVAPPANVGLPVRDLAVLAIPDREGEARRRAVEFGSLPFDLQRGPLWRLELLRVAEENHILLFTTHHILIDGWSRGVFVSELIAHYDAFAMGETARLRPPPIQYTDFSWWQREIQSRDFPPHVDYWMSQLAGAPEVLELPADRSRPSGRDYRGARHPIALDEELVAKLREIGQRNQCTLFVTLLTGFAALIHRYTERTDIVLGSPVANRTRSELEGLIGFFVNMLPLRLRPVAGATFRETLEAVRKTALEASAHQDLPFEEIVRNLSPARSLDHNPIFQVVFILQSDPVPKPPTQTSLALEGFEVDPETAKFDLTLSLTEAGDRVEGWIEYATDLFDPDRIARMATHLRCLLEAAAADPDAPLSVLTILPADERRRLLVDWNATGSEYASHRCIHEVFEAQADSTPDAVALVFEEEAMTYRELDRRANVVARRLRREGVRSEVTVGVCLDRSFEAVVAFLGILKAGGAYVPLDPSDPKDRLAFLLDDARIGVLLTASRFAATLPEHGARRLFIETEDWGSAGERLPRDEEAATPETLAYVLYTSGSTGQPKGVEVVHRGVVRLVNGVDYVRLSREDVLLQYASLAFDASTFEVWGSLLNGARLVVPPPGPVSLPELERVIRAHGVTTIWLTAGLFHAVVDERPGALTGVPQVLAGGDVLSVPHTVRFLESCPGSRLINGYGPTEGTTFTCAYDVTRSDREKSSIPIGRPIANTRVYLLDSNRQPVPIGIPGEIYIGGDGLARGYLGRPDLTAERFVDDPFGLEPEGKLYRTGDMARYYPDGNLEFLGRRDNQVKVRGFRIELGEVETRLLAHPAVREAAVVVREESGEKRLVAYWVPWNGEEPTVTALRAHLKERLPEYMVPSAFIRLEAFPLTANGKVDHRRLPAPDQARPELVKGFIPPQTEEEKELARIWGEVLRLERIGIHDNFFELGGDSILSIQIVAKANRAGLRLTPQQMFQHQTVAELARFVGATSAVRAEQGVVAGDVPLTPIQRWFFGQNLSNPQHFNQSVVLRVRGPLEAEILERALGRLTEHHDALRLRFEPAGARWVQSHGAPADTLVFERVDLSGLSSEDRAAAIDRTVARLQAGFDLARGPMFRAALVDLGPDGRRLILAGHHLVVDGVSWRILLEDLETLYEALRSGRPARLPLKTTSFKEWAQRLRDYAGSSALNAERSYWSSLDEATVENPPPDFEAGPNTVSSEQAVSISLSREETGILLHAVPARYGTQINDALLTALLRAFQKSHGVDSIRIDLEGHGREASFFGGVDLSRSVGWFTTLFPVVLRGSRGSAGTEELLSSVREQLRRVPRRGIGYGLVRSGETVGAAAERDARSAIRFNYLGQFDQVVADSALFGSLEWAKCPRHPDQLRSHGMDVDTQIVDGRLEIEWRYSANLHSSESVARLARAFVEALRELTVRTGDTRNAPSLEDPAPVGGTTVSVNAEQRMRVVAELGPDADRPRDDRIEGVHRLSPQQLGMLLESLRESGVGLHMEQAVHTLRGDLDQSALREALQKLTERHSILRTGFVWKLQDEPLQAVLSRVEVPLEIQDWRAESPAQRKRKLATHLAAERGREFDLSAAPLMRVALFRIEDRAHWMVWTLHHIVIDGWSWPTMTRELFQIYDAVREGERLELEPARPYSDYLAWLERQDLAAAEGFWRGYLQGVAGPTALGREGAATDEPAPVDRFGVEEGGLSAEATARLKAVARDHRVTLSTVVQGAWTLLLHRYSGDPDVIFGTTVAGRPSELAGAEGMVGLFINTLPLRIRVEPEVPVARWLGIVQEKHLAVRSYEHCSAGQVHRWSDVPGSLPLYESILVFENYPHASAIFRSKSLTIDTAESQHSGARTSYAMTLLVGAGEALSLRLVYDARRLSGAAAANVCKHLALLLEGIATGPGQGIAQLVRRIPEDEVPRVGESPSHSRRVMTAAFLGPRTETERSLAAIWRRILGVTQVDVRDNFFELGGHSMLALELFTQVEESLDRRLPLATLFEAPTLEGLARLLDQEDWTPKWSSLVPIQAHGTRPPLYCVHGHGGNVLTFEMLSRHLGPDQPLYGLQAPGLNGGDPYSRMEDLAAHYVRDVLAFQPEGPYFLEGMSFGGLVAFEMAQQLKAMGKEVALLALFDTYPPHRGKVMPTLSTLRRLELRASEVLTWSWRERVEFLQRRLWEPLRQRVGGKRGRRKARAEEEPMTLRALAAVRQANTLAAARYEPQPYDGRVVIFWASSSFLGSTHRFRMGWNALVPRGLELHVIPGSHITMFDEPYVSVLASELTECVTQALERSRRAEGR